MYTSVIMGGMMKKGAWVDIAVACSAGRGSRGCL